MAVRHLEHLKERLKDSKTQLEALEGQLEEQVEVRMVIEERLAHAMEQARPRGSGSPIIGTERARFSASVSQS